MDEARSRIQIVKQKGTEPESFFHFSAFCLLYAFGEFGFLVTALIEPHVFRRLEFNSRCFFFESFSKGTYFSIVKSPPLMLL